MDRDPPEALRAGDVISERDLAIAGAYEALIDRYAKLPDELALPLQAVRLLANRVGFEALCRALEEHGTPAIARQCRNELLARQLFFTDMMADHPTDDPNDGDKLREALASDLAVFHSDRGTAYLKAFLTRLQLRKRKLVPYLGAGDEARRRVVALHEQWMKATKPGEVDPIGTRRRRLLGRPLSSTATEDCALSTPTTQMPERLTTEMMVRAILLAEELGVGQLDPDWYCVLERRLTAHTISGGCGWFAPRRSAGRGSPFSPDVLAEASELLDAPPAGPPGATNTALGRLLERKGYPSSRTTVRKLREAVRYVQS